MRKGIYHPSLPWTPDEELVGTLTFFHLDFIEQPVGCPQVRPWTPLAENELSLLTLMLAPPARP